ncbi:MAG: polysulfide reductase NrfD [Leptospiraceae bacterium]|nr:polysulfide reductase NrfD [Leptospiraceae bacterium]
MDNIEIDITRHNPHIDPWLSVWEYQIPLYLFLGGITAGLLVLSSLYFLMNKKEAAPFTVSVATCLAPLFLSIGMFFLFLDLTHKLYVWRLYLTWELTSPMSWGSWALILIYPVSILYAAMQLPEEYRQNIRDYLKKIPYLKGLWAFVSSLLDKLYAFADSKQSWAPRLAMINIVMGLFIGIYTGILLSTFIARPFWNTPLLGVLFLTSGLSGASAVIIMASKSHREEIGMIKLDLGILIAELVIMVLIFVGFLTQSAYHNAAGELVLGGKYTGYFWMLVMLQGILFPIFMEIMELKNVFKFKYITPISVLIGGLLLRFLFVYIGQYSSVGIY